MKKIFTHVNPHLERLEAAVHAQTAATGPFEIETEQPTPIEMGSKKSKSNRRKTQNSALNSDSEDSKESEDDSSSSDGFEE